MFADPDQFSLFSPNIASIRSVLHQTADPSLRPPTEGARAIDRND
jgi:hypothetical protein